MSGTQESNLFVQNSSENAQTGQSGIDQNQQEPIEEAKELSPSQKMDELLRGNSSVSMKKEIEKLRKEAAKYRTSSKANETRKLELEQKSQEIQKELDSLKESHRRLSVIRKLDKAGCIKSELVAKDVPENCESIDDFIEAYKEENKFLFKAQKNSVGSTFKSSGAKSLTPSQKMDAYIRAALGR